MQLIERFHQIESENALFELGKDLNIPLWDIIRYHVYVKYYYPEQDRNNLSISQPHSIFDYFSLVKYFFIFIYGILFWKGENVFLTSSRYLNNSGQYFDKSANHIIESAKNNCIVIEPVLGKKMAYTFLYDFSCILRKFKINKKIPIEYYTKINNVLEYSFGVNLITYTEVNTIYNDFKSDYLFYKIIFRLKETKKLFISTGNPKASLKAAEDLNIKTYLVQHAGIEFDEVDYSYPKILSAKSTILFPQYLLTFGDYWCKNMNVPSQSIIPIGNDFFFNKPIVSSDNSILIISTIIHGGELSKLTIQLANQWPNLLIVYKLHPNEFHLKNKYVNDFKEITNIKVITNEIDTNVLIARCQLVILIVSAVLYEALNQNKKVLIYKKINYERQLALSMLPNVYFFDIFSEVSDILSKPNIINTVNFYKATDYTLIKNILAT